jgi:hypothetical protein
LDPGNRSYRDGSNGRRTRPEKVTLRIQPSLDLTPFAPD